MLNGADPDFIEKYIGRKNLLYLNCFPVTPNCHRVTEVPYAISSGSRLSFVSIFLFCLVVLNTIIFINCHMMSIYIFLIWYFIWLNIYRMTGLDLVRNWLISGVQLMN